MVLFMSLPENRGALVAHLIKRGRAHFLKADEAMLEAAAAQLADDRQEAKEQRRSPLPGQAEYLDLLRAVLELRPDDPAAQKDLLTAIGQYALKKHSGSE
jgi:hypothetical protein